MIGKWAVTQCCYERCQIEDIGALIEIGDYVANVYDFAVSKGIQTTTAGEDIREVPPIDEVIANTTVDSVPPMIVRMRRFTRLAIPIQRVIPAAPEH